MFLTGAVWADYLAQGAPRRFTQ